MRQKLSTTESVTSSYSGSFAGDYISAMFLAAPTLANGTVTIKQNIAYKEVIKKLATSGLISANSCDFTPTGTITLTERVLEPMKMKVDLKLCKGTYANDWEAMDMGFGNNTNLPPKFSDYLIGVVSKSVAGTIEQLYWSGDGNSGATMGFSGITTLLKADSTVLDVSGVTITSSNVQAEIAKVIAKLATTNIYSQGEKPVIYCATDVIMNYLVSLGSMSASNGYLGQGPAGVDKAPLMAFGIQLIEAPGLTSGQMIGAQVSNIYFGTGLLSDYNQVMVIDQTPIDSSDNVIISLKFSAAANYGIGAEIVYYWIY